MFFRPKFCLTEKKKRLKKISSKNFFGRKTFRPKNFQLKKCSAENFAVRIAEGGSNEGPPVRPAEKMVDIISAPPLLELFNDSCRRLR